MASTKSSSEPSELLGSERTSGAGRLVAGLLVGPAILGLLRAFPQLDLVLESPTGHFWIVTGATMLALALVLVMLRAGVVRRDGRVLLIAAAFLGLSSIFLVHAVSTPGVMFANAGHATAWSTPIALLAGAVVLGLSTVEPFAAQAWLVRRWRLAFFGGFLAWLAYAGFMLVYVPAHERPAGAVAPTAAMAHTYGSDATYHGTTPAVPVDPRRPNSTTAAEEMLQSQLMALLPRALPPIDGATVLLYLGTALVYGRRLRHGSTLPLVVLTVGAVLLAETTIASYFGPLWHLSFWLYHVLLMAAILTVTYGVVLGYEQSGSISRAVEGLLLDETLNRQRRGFQQGMAILLGALEQGDPGVLPAMRKELRSRFGLADDQIELLEHAVEVVAQEREEQQRLRALAEVSRAATLDLDPDLLLSNAIAAFAGMTGASLCAAGLVAGDVVVFHPRHRILHGVPAPDVITVPVGGLPGCWIDDQARACIGPLGGDLRSLAAGPGDAILVPIAQRSRLMGILAVQPGGGAPIDEHMEAVCCSIGSHLALALANAHLFQDLQREHQDLQRSEQARDQLTQMVVHDLKNPLTAVRINLELLRMTSLTAEQLEMVGDAHRGSSIILRLVTDMLDVARLEEGRLQIRRSWTHLASLLEGCMDELRPWADQEQKPMRLAVPDALPPLYVDGSLLRRVMVNLLSNAIKHTPAGTPISVEAESSPPGIRLRVRDCGPGIPAELRQHLFERWSAGAGRGRGQINTGLGLTFCRLAVDAHGGSIVVESSPAGGTTFTVELPAQVLSAPEAVAAT